MNINPLLPQTCIVAILLFVFGWLVTPRLPKRMQRFFITLSLPAALPAFLFIYFYIFKSGEPLLYYRFRAIPYTEMCAAGIALPAGQLFGIRYRADTYKIINFRVFYPIMVFVLVPVPFVKPAVMPLDYDRKWSRWEDGVCMQTTTATCGPCSAATLLRQAGLDASEKEIARATYSYAHGTENWYIARYLTSRGLKTRYAKTEPNPQSIPYPSIAGVRGLGYGHFIVVLDKTPRGYVIADSLVGKSIMTKSKLYEAYKFTGFFMVVENDYIAKDVMRRPRL